MLCVCWLLFFFCFSAFFVARRGVLELFWTGSLTVCLFSYFCVKAKTSRHFSGAPVYISFLLFFSFAIITVIGFFFKSLIYKEEEKNLCSQRKHDVWSLEWGRHSFVNRTKPDYAEPFWGSCRLLKTPPKKLKGDRGLKKVEISGGAARPSMLLFAQ